MHYSGKNEAWYGEYVKGALTGSIYGFTTILVGQPLDTVKTLMQTQASYAGERGANTVTTWRPWLLKIGIKGLYKGSVPAFTGSIAFRSVQWAAYNGTYDHLNSEFYQQTLPCTGGLQARVVLASIAAGSARAIIECPFEYVKVMMQVGKRWVWQDVFKGFAAIWARDVPLFIVALGLIDTMKRKTTAMESYPGIFAGTGLCAVAAWAAVWPLETIKNQIQTGDHAISLRKQLAHTFRPGKNGAFMLYRGMVPGMVGIFLRTGAAFASMAWANSTLVPAIESSMHVSMGSSGSALLRKATQTHNTQHHH